MIKIILKILSITLVLLTATINAQTFQGKAYYQTKRNVNMKLDSSEVNNEMQKQIQEMIRKQFEKTYILTFNKTESIYKEEQQLAKPQSQSGITIQVGSSSDILYKNIKSSIYTKSNEVFGKRFLVKDKLEALDWTISKETKMIGKYLCIKATHTKMVDDFDDDFEKKEEQKELNIIAWYTPEIPVSIGPEQYGGLPGLIIELHEDKMHFVCSKIILNPTDKIDIVAPTKGKKMNQKEFDAMNDKKSKEMMEQFKNNRKKGSNGNTFSIQVGG